MSPRAAGLPPAPPPTEPVLATAVILHHDGPDGREVFLVRRGEARRFAGGFHAFPGGRVDPEDRHLPVAGASGDDAVLLACAARELFEETGVLLARGAERLSRADRDAARRALLDGTLAFAAFLGRAGLALEAAPFVPAGRWITPAYLPLRYDARLFLAALPPSQDPEVWPGELADGALVPARRALARWEEGEVLLHPPNLNALRVLAREGPIDLAALRDPPHCLGAIAQVIEFQGGLWLAALRTPTLPPATHTNAWVVDLGDGVAVVDPGAPERAERARLDALLELLEARGRPPREIWVTHAHPDHVGGVAALAAARGLPVRAHPAAAVRAGVAVRPLREGDLLHGRWRVLETPGHARDHLVFLDERTGALLCGDMVSTLSTIVIDPPEGDMAEYERQLARLRARSPRTLYPGHGPPAPNAPAFLTKYLEHRETREALVAGALAEGGTLEEITRRAYADTPAPFHPVASRSCLAVLEKLRARGRALEEGEGIWHAR